MELVFGTQVRSNGRRLGYLAGLEVDPASSTVTKIIFSDDGTLGPHAHTRARSAVRVEGGILHIGDAPPAVTTGEPLLLSRSTRLMRRGREAARLSGAAIDDNGVLQALFGRQHWWTKRQRFDATALDFSAPGEIRSSETQSAAA